MTEILMGKEFFTICARGHTGYAPRGSDIVCSAVSTLMQTYPAALRRAGIEPVVISGKGAMAVVPNIGSSDEAKARAGIIYATVAAGLRLLERSYGDNIRIRETGA